MIPTVEDLAKWQEMERDLNRMARRLKCGIFEVANRVEEIMARIDRLNKEIEEYNRGIKKGGLDG